MRVRTPPPYPQFCQDVLGLDLSTRHVHMTHAKAVDGLPLNDEELAIFRRYTGRSGPRPGGYPFDAKVVGRQGGKTEDGAARLTYAATSAVLAGKRDVAAVGMSQDQRAAQRVLFGYVLRFFEMPLLKELVIGQTQDTITLIGHVRLLVLPCRPASIRGLRCVCVVLDEVAHFRSTDNQPLDREAWRAALPTLLTTGGKLHALSSPYVASGLMYDLHGKHYGNDDSDVLILQAPSYAVNPTLSTAALDQIRDADPEGAEAEIEGLFLRHVSALHDEDAIRAAIDQGIVARPRQSRPVHFAHVDVATGAKSTGDRWACAIAHAEGGTAILDALLLIKPPFSPDTAARQTADLCRSYGLGVVKGDRFAGGFSNEAFARAGMKLEPSEKTTSDLHIEFAGLLTSGRARILDSPELASELRGLERRRGATRDRVDHRRGGHDDLACAVAGAMVAAAAVDRSGPTAACLMPDGSWTAWQ